MANKRTRSWSEIDKNRGKRRGAQEDERAQERLSGSQTYQDYKKSVEKLFSGGGELPDSMKGALDPSGIKARRDAALKNLQKLEAESRPLWLEAAFTFAMEHELPEDAYFLDSLLNHSKDRVVDKALGKLEQLAEAGRLVGTKHPKSLEQRLRSIELTSLDDEQKARAKALRAKLT